MKLILLLLAVSVVLFVLALWIYRRNIWPFMNPYNFTIGDQEFTNKADFDSLEALAKYLKKARSGHVTRPNRDVGIWIYQNILLLLPHLVDMEAAILLNDLVCGVFPPISLDEILEEAVKQKKGASFFSKLLPSHQTAEQWTQLLEKVEKWSKPTGCPEIEKFLRSKINRPGLITAAIPAEPRKPGTGGRT